MPRYKGSAARQNLPGRHTGQPQYQPDPQRRQKRQGRYRDPVPTPPKGQGLAPATPQPVPWLSDQAFRRYLETLGDALYGRTPAGRITRSLLRRINSIHRAREIGERIAISNVIGNAQVVANGYSVCGSGGDRLVMAAGLCAWNGTQDVVGNSLIYVGSLPSRPSAFTARDYNGVYDPNPAFSRMTQRAAYTRTVVNGNNPYITSRHRPGVRPFTPTNIWPWIPPLTPLTTPIPVPISALGVRPNNTSQPVPTGRQGPRPGTGRGGLPKPPGPGVKEKKGMSKAGKLVFAAMNAYTETDDLANALFDALPGYIKGQVYAKAGKPKGGLNTAQKLLAVYRNIKSLNVGQAVKNVIANQVEDAFVGRLAGGASKRFGKGAGVGMAGSRLGGLGGGT